MILACADDGCIWFWLDISFLKKIYGCTRKKKTTTTTVTTTNYNRCENTSRGGHLEKFRKPLPLKIMSLCEMVNIAQGGKCSKKIIW